MKQIVSVLIFAALALAGCCKSHERIQTIEETRENGALRHVVLFSFKPDATPEQIKEVEDAFRALPAQIPEIKDFEWGTDVGVEGLSKGFTHAFLLTFEDEKARAVYLPHPAHKAFGQIVGKYIDDVLVIDYWARE